MPSMFSCMCAVPNAVYVLVHVGSFLCRRYSPAHASFSKPSMILYECIVVDAVNDSMYVSRCPCRNVLVHVRCSPFHRCSCARVPFSMPPMFSNMCSFLLPQMFSCASVDFNA
ncbi:hypothetical protein PoB_001838700 [Plakobranchus ocellatus]|uniref:Secreted protein n=1 Tax=Plakobranchus ocellatus TaxID=259542 RepID=A0AAV3ZBG1_9GAST|nr:hypothetical protein PoB_001838700 [Plakobranchus ocellatus]